MNKVTMHEALRTLPSNMRLRSHIDGKIATVTELLAKRDEPGVWISKLREDYGHTVRTSIVCDYGIIYSEVK